MTGTSCTTRASSAIRGRESAGSLRLLASATTNPGGPGTRTNLRRILRTRSRLVRVPGWLGGALGTHGALEQSEELQQFRRFLKAVAAAASARRLSQSLALPAQSTTHGCRPLQSLQLT